MAENYSVEMCNISKAFGGVQALKNVNFAVRKGEIHALVGENGAGKSTLMKILAGAISKDKGTIFIDGKEANITGPRSAMEQGVAIIYQEFVLASHLTVAENIFLNRLSSGRFIKWQKLYEEAQKIISSVGFDIQPNAVVDSLSVAHKQVVEICKALSENSRILILDEPTAVLATKEVERLFTLLENLKKQGVSIIYISHRLDEVFRISDSITVLKDGATMGTMKTEETNKDEVISKMIGRKLTAMFPPRKAKIGDVVLKVSNLNRGRLVKNVSFEVRAGEIVGLGGLVGAGRTETARTIFGADPLDSGEVYLLNRRVNVKDPVHAVKLGLGMLPEDRKEQGVLLEMPVRINITLSCLDKISTKLNWILRDKENELVKNLIQKMAIKVASAEHNTSSLSGGNQQKVALSKWLASECKFLILDEPTRGVDVGAKLEIYKLINEIAEQGVGILMISSDLPELIGMCDRVLVMKDGQITGQVDKADLNEENILRLAIGQ
jgi:ribose transport system ATP-binding protein